MKKVLFLSIAFLLFRTVPTILSGRFTFAFDMGRDMLWVRNMVELRKPTLIGPWGSIAGIYFGPLWFYLLSAPYVFFDGDPRGAVVVPLISNVATLLIGWWYLRRKKHPTAATIWAILYGFSPLVISISGFAFHANLLPLATLLFLIGLHSLSVILTRQKERKNLAERPPDALSGFGMTAIGFPLAALVASISYHLEPAAGVMLTMYLGVRIVGMIRNIGKFSKKSVTQLLSYSVIAFTLPFLPQLVFELRHDFVQTKALVSYFKGENESLGGVLPLSERIPERVTKFARTLSQSVLPLDDDRQKWILLGVFGVLMIMLMMKKTGNEFSLRFTLHAFLFLLFHYLSYTFLFPAELKNWYLFGFASVFLMVIALIVENRIRSSERFDPPNLNSVEIFNRVLMVSLVAFWAWRTVDPLALSLERPLLPAAPETLAAQLEVVDWIYQDAKEHGRPFSVYTYTPPIYDYTYQYLLWWKGTRRYGMLPAEFSYQPGETSYLPEKERFVSQEWKPEDAEIIYLILEPDSVESRREGWLGHFAIQQIQDKHEFSSGVTVEIRQRTPIIPL